MRLIYHPGAEAEMLEAVQFYERRMPGLGDRFLRAFDAAIAEILIEPERWPIIEGDLRRRLIRQFPFGVYYRVEGDDLRILVVKHHSRHPEYWRDRLDG